MFYLYNLVQLSLFIMGIPLWAFLLIKKKKYRQRIRERMGFLSPELLSSKAKPHGERIVIHGVSVGEINAALPLVEKISRDSAYAPVLTATTHTGYNNAAQKCPGCPVLYFPLDFLFSVRRFLDFTNPRAVIIMETEIWPNFLFEAKRRNIPVFIVNARISDKSFKGYIKFRFFFKRVFSLVKRFAVQTEIDRDRLIALGTPPALITVTGNLKFYSAVLSKDEKKKELLRNTLKLRPEHKVFLAGSTHPGEEKIIVTLWKELFRTEKNLRLIIAPRHVERKEEIARLLSSEKTPFTLFSQVKTDPEIKNVILVDTIGDLFNLYSIADIVFIGKSLIPPGGGQNVIEPAVWGKPILFGPFMSHFRAIAEAMAAQNAAIEVRDEKDLKEQLDVLLKNNEKRSRYSRNAAKFVESNKDSFYRTLEIIFHYLDNNKS
jgi:3-deoxy-D-manno-octulosonic-acid transferase